MSRLSLMLVLAAAVLVVACGGSTMDTIAAPQGTETGACYPNGTCNAGLVCLSNTCVNPGGTDGGGGIDSSSSDSRSGNSDAPLPGADSSAVDAGGSVDARPDAPGSSDARDDAGLLCPGANILHPGTQTRSVNTPVPFVGRARDASCNALTGASLVWTDNLEGMIGTGETFNYTFLMTGTHTVTLTAADAQGATYTTTITFMIA